MKIERVRRIEKHRLGRALYLYIIIHIYIGTKYITNIEYHFVDIRLFFRWLF